jgi:uncharacterized protein
MVKSTTLQEPTQAHERIQAIDILRGFALLGIITINFSGSEAARIGSLDDTVRRLIDFLVSSKFYTTFSFLFGLGFALQLLRARLRKSRIVPVYIRRMAVLYLIGMFHAIVIWTGDVLLIYAAMGLLLILFRKLPGMILLVFVLLTSAFALWNYLPSYPPARLDGYLPARHNPELQQQRDLERALDYVKMQEAGQNLQWALHSGTFFQAVKARFQVYKLRGPFLWSYFWPEAFMMFLLGLYAGRRGIFHDLAGHRKLLRTVMWTALPLALVLNLYYAVGAQVFGSLYQKMPDWGSGLVYIFAGPAGSLFYISGIVLLLLKSERWLKRLGFFRWVGRMPLTNYLMQSIIGTFVYYHYGLGLMNRIGYLPGLALTMAVFVAQIPLSRWWLGRFQFGPVEWLWRSLTYLKAQPMRIPKPRPVEAS